MLINILKIIEKIGQLELNRKFKPYFQYLVLQIIVFIRLYHKLIKYPPWEYAIQMNFFEKLVEEIIVVEAEILIADRIMCQIGCRKACCYRPVCAPGCTRACCVVVTCPPGCVRSCCRVVCPPGCVRSCCRVVCPPGCVRSCCRVVCLPGCVKPCCRKIVCRPGCVKTCCVNNPGLNAFNVCKNILKWNNEQWCQRTVYLTRTVFDSHQINHLSKLKSRKRLEPHSFYLNKNQNIMKAVFGYNDFYYASCPYTIEQLFIKMILSKLHSPNIPQDIKFPGEMSGYILKKSDYLGNWEQRYVTINQVDGLKSFKNKDELHTLHIRYTKQIWTWFQILHGKYLVIKVKNLYKHQFAIPIKYLDTWLPAFYILLRIQQY